MRINISTLLLLSALVSPAWADDSVEAAATGNIVFEKAPELIMQNETLTIDKTAGSKLGADTFTIDVDFIFKNTAKHDVTRKMAFVLPPVFCRMDDNTLWRGLETDTRSPTSNNGLKDFTTTVDDKSQSYTTRTEATLNQQNITALLTKLQIPLNPCKIEATAKGDPDPKYSNNLKKYHLLTESNDAAWAENIYFEWTQTFPAGKTVHIHHQYTPVIGESVLAPRTINDINNEFAVTKLPMLPIWNHPLDTLSQANPSLTVINKTLDPNITPEKRFCVMPQWIEYNLKTGANWNGGIGVFKLIIKDNNNTPFAVNQFYKKKDVVQTSINNTSMTFTTKNFIPTQNLFILFLATPKSAIDSQGCGL